MGVWKKESEIKYEKALPKETKTFRARLFRPRIDAKLCKKCMVCVVSCPDNCIEISKSGSLAINYNCCNGCLICLRECPCGAISEEKENES